MQYAWAGARSDAVPAPARYVNPRPSGTTMNAVFFDARLSDDARRAALYRGQLFVYSPTPASTALVDFARGMIRDAFGSLDPTLAQHEMPVEGYAQLLSDLKPKFIHHPSSKECIRRMLTDFGCDPDRTYFDVPRMRTSTSDGYLTTGIAYAFHPHRDTWYSAPMCQINWWIPIFETEPDNVMAFHPRYWNTPLRNGSRDYNYQEWNRTSRFIAAQQVGVDTRKQPKPEEPVELDPQVRPVVPPGGVVLFSAAHLHSSVPNTTGKTRFSIDFRTVHLDDVTGLHGAPNCDSECTGTTMGDYLRVSDLAHVPDELAARFESGTPLVTTRSPSSAPAQ
jgi:hypothetical protein